MLTTGIHRLWDSSLVIQDSLWKLRYRSSCEVKISLLVHQHVSHWRMINYCVIADWTHSYIWLENPWDQPWTIGKAMCVDLSRNRNPFFQRGYRTLPENCNRPRSKLKQNRKHEKARVVKPDDRLSPDGASRYHTPSTVEYYTAQNSLCCSQPVKMISMDRSIDLRIQFPLSPCSDWMRSKCLPNSHAPC